MKIFFAALALAAGIGPAWGDDLSQQVRDYRAKHEAAIVGQLDELTRLQSVAANPDALAVTAARLESLLKARGFKTQQMTPPGAPPVVFGSHASPGAKRTVIFYAHYDGQPVTRTQWSSDPFVPVVRDGLAGKDVDWKSVKPPFNPEWRLFGRATADDKGAIIAFLAGFDALKAIGRKPSVNIKVVWTAKRKPTPRIWTQFSRIMPRSSVVMCG